MLVMHDGGLSSSVALAMACKIAGPDKIVVYSSIQQNNRWGYDAIALYEELGINPNKVLMRYFRVDSKQDLIAITKDATADAIEHTCDEIITGIYNKGDYEVAMALHHAMQKVVVDRSDNNVRLRSPLIELIYTDLINKSVDFELPLNCVRDCIGSTIKFCGICLPCRHRIAQFQRVGLMDYDYVIDIDWGLPPETQREFEAWQEWKAEHG